MDHLWRVLDVGLGAYGLSQMLHNLASTFERKSRDVFRRNLALIVSLLIALSGAAAQSRAYFGRTTDPTPVNISIQDKNEVVHFRIPRVFMTFSENWEDGLQTGITLETIFPTMTPLSATRSSMAGFDVVVINLESYAHTGASYSMSQNLPYKIAQQWAFVDQFIDETGRSYRYYVNKQDIENSKDSSRLLKQFFVPEEPDIYFECFRELANPLVGCSGFVTYGQSLCLRFQFKKAQLKRWPEIRDAVLALLNSFRQKV